MGKGKRGKVTAAGSPRPAARHVFTAGGLLGHDLTAPWIVNVGEVTALGLDVFYACVDAIASAVAGSDMNQWNGTNRIEEPAPIVRTPDPDLTQWEFKYLFAANLAIYQAVYLEEAAVDGEVIGVRCIPVPHVSRVGDDLYVLGNKVTNRLRLVRRSLWPTLDVDVQAVIQLGREDFAGMMAANAYTSDFWQEGGAPQWYIKTEQPLTTTQATELQDAVVASRTTSPGKPGVYGRGSEPKVLGIDLGSEGAHVAADKMAAKIARRMRVPPSIVNVPSEAGSLTYTTTEGEGLHFVKYTVQPYNDVIGDAITRYLPGDAVTGDRVILANPRLTMADQLSRFNAWKVATGKPFMRVAEVRDFEHLPPDPELDDDPEPTLTLGGNVGGLN